MVLLLATSNQDKVAEFQALFDPMSCVGQNILGIDSPEETGQTFIENALIKARHAARLGKMPALADDSGLVVEALHGAPGIYSARYAGFQASYEDNMALVLQKLQGLPWEKRRAYFYCVLVYMESEKDPAPVVAEGRWYGYITEERAGSKGFGYDPIFYVEELGTTVGALEESIKNAYSHRAKAVAVLKNKMKVLKL